MKFKLVIGGALISTLFACSTASDQPSSSALSPDDITQIKAVSQKYVDAWLQDDTSGVLDLFVDTAIIIPSGMNPKTGKAALRAFWFPDDSSRTVIHAYEVEVLNVDGRAFACCSGYSPRKQDGIAYTLEQGHLSFSYEKGDFQMSRESNAFATTILKKADDGVWKIVQRMWSDQR